MIRAMVPFAVGVLALTFTPPVPAAEAFDPRDIETREGQQTDFFTATRNNLQGAWRVTELLGMEVRGVNEEDIGEVEDLLFAPSGRVEYVIIEGGGIFDLGDTHFRMEWHEMDFSPGREWVSVPMTEETVQGLSDPLADWEDRTTLWTWRATDLLDNTVNLEDASGYGRAADLIVEAGQIRAVLVAPEGGQIQAFPYGEYDPRLGGAYTLPYSRDDARPLGELIGQ